MKIELYRTLLCPRCLLVSRALNKIAENFPQIELEVIEVATHLVQTHQAGIRTVPAIKIGNDVLTGLILTPQKIRRFIDQHLQDEESTPPASGH